MRSISVSYCGYLKIADIWGYFVTSKLCLYFLEECIQNCQFDGILLI